MANHRVFSSSSDTFKTDPLGTFQVIEKIGDGNFSTVYKALNKITDKLVAIKIFPMQEGCAYEEEIEFLKSLDHPFIDKFIDIYQAGPQIWMIQDYCQLGSVFDIIRITNEPLSEPEIACICYNVLYALDYLHTLGKVHNSVKTNNIMVASSGQIRLTDFGSVLWMGTDMVEQSEGYSADMWALGICIIEMVEGNSTIRQQQLGQRQRQIPFGASIIKQIGKSCDSLSYSSELKDFISQCLQIDPKKRPRASKLFDHQFIHKYKKDLPQIRKKFCQDKQEKIAEYRKSLTNRGKVQPERVQTSVLEPSFGEENVPDESEMTSNTAYDIAQRLNHENTIEYTLESDNYLASAIKPSFNLTEEPSRIEMLSRTPIYMNVGPTSNRPEPTSQIKPFQADESNEQSFNVTARSEQLSVISQSPRLCLSATKKNVKIPPLKLNATTPLNQEKKPVNHLHYNSEQIYNKGKENERGLAFAYTCAKPQPKIMKPKMYKATNESNFVVKHKISMTTMNTHLNCSVDSETTLNPISLDRQKLPHFTDVHGINSTRQLIEELENVTTNIPRLSFKDLREHTVSTAADSKSSRYKSIFQTPSVSDCRKSAVLKVVQENLEHARYVYTEEAPEIDPLDQDVKTSNEAKRVILEAQMKRELEEIQKKYNMMFKGLSKSGGGPQKSNH